MLSLLGYQTLDDLIDVAVPPSIRVQKRLNLPPARTEFEALADLRKIASENKVFRSFIGQGYYDTITPPVIQRNVLENPGWYTQYTPYQAEISQGRLEALLNFQTMVTDLTALDIANASLLDESTACAEAMTLSARIRDGRNVFFVSETCHPQNIEVIHTRAQALGMELIVGKFETFEFSEKVFGALVQYPDSFGAIHDYSGFAEKAHAAGALLTVATDLLALTPMEFEQLIRELFQAMGMKSWVTQASMDSGIDVVAVNEDPIVGGLCIIQAKRYRKAVGPESLRALAGVVEDKRAAKGILITTSWASKASHDFVMRYGRIEIIEGQQLKAMLKEHLGLDVRIDVDRPQ